MESRIAGMVVAALLILAACSAEVLSDDATAPGATSTTDTVPSVERPEGSVLVKVTGPVQVGAGGIREICAGQGDPCAGIRLAGQFGFVRFDAAGHPTPQDRHTSTSTCRRSPS